MDINDARSAVTLLGLILFVCLVVWAWSGKRRAAFDEAARTPFLDSDGPVANNGAGEQR